MSRGKLLLLDVGNSGVKWRLLGNAGEFLGRGRAMAEDLVPKIESELEHTGACPLVLVSSVAAQASNDSLRAGLESLGCSVWFASARSELGGLRNSYAQPCRMGVDRWLAMLAARTVATQRVCVIDAGSALTIDIVSHAGEHEGGYIIPGKSLMQRALFSDTDRVRFANEEAPGLTPGTSTAEAVAHGLLLAQCGAVLLALSEAQREAPLEQVFLTGGDALQIASLLSVPTGVSIIVNPDMVFAGLVRQAQLEEQVSEDAAVAFLKEVKLYTRMD